LRPARAKDDAVRFSRLLKNRDFQAAQKDLRDEAREKSILRLCSGQS